MEEAGTAKWDSAMTYTNENSSRQAALWAAAAEVEECAARTVRRGRAAAVSIQSGAQRATTRLGTGGLPVREDEGMTTEITDIWQRLKETDAPIVIYGTGNGADKLLNELERLEIPVSGIMASDGFVRSRTFRGFPVRSLSEIEEKFPSPLILLAFGSQRPEVIEHILNLSRRHTVLCADVPVCGEQIFNGDFFHRHVGELNAALELMSDDLSRKTFENVVRFKLTGELSALTECFCEKEEAFTRLLRLGSRESYLDLGAYRGDTIEEFLRYTGGRYREIVALEPDPKTYRKLRENIVLPGTRLFNMGIWSHDTDLPFRPSLGRGSSLGQDGTQVLPVTAIDTLFRRRPLTYLKVDVEGAEEQALLGGENTLRRDKPKLNLALYHRSEDLFRLPLLLHRIRPDYRLYLRQHPHLPAWDLNLYGV